MSPDFEQKVLDQLTDIKVRQAENHGEVMLVSQRVTAIENERSTEKWQRYGLTIVNLLLTGLGLSARKLHG